MTNSILVCTVGGSPAPIVSAIRQERADLVVFVCSEDDPATGSRGSHTMIEGSGETIVKQAGLGEGTYRIWPVPADGLEDGYRRLFANMNELVAEFPEAAIVADYTGGTKSMSAVLALVAVEMPQVRLQLVSGPRADLVKVRDGMEAPLRVALAEPRMRRAVATVSAAWRAHFYDQAQAGFSAMLADVAPEFRPGIQRLRDLSGAFAAWDRFDHASAEKIIDVYARPLGAWIAPWRSVARLLARDDREKREPLAIQDVWLNAQRRAAQGRYDDAVARCYRMIEWMAQWLLFRRAGIADTGAIPTEAVPAALHDRLRRMVKGKGPDRREVYEAGLMDAWTLLARLDPDGPAARFFEGKQHELRGQLGWRSQSILAHGMEPVTQQGWSAFSSWMEAGPIVVLDEEMRRNKIGLRVQQLPTEPPSVEFPASKRDNA